MLLRASFVFAVLLAAATTHAHPVTVDGDPSDWLGRAPGSANTAIVARDAAGWGELVWADPTGDERTDFASPDGRVDLVAFATTADATNLYFRVALANVDLASGNGAPQIQIALDLDQTADSGQRFFAALSDTQVPSEARWEYLVQTRFGSANGDVTVFDSDFMGTNGGSAVLSMANDVCEIAVPWSLLGAAALPARVRLSVALFRSDTSDEAFDIGGASDALDVLSNYGDPGTTPNTFDEVGDGVLDHSVDVHFDSGGEVFAPLQIVRYLYEAGTFPEYVVLRNATAGDLELGAFALGDEESPNRSEGMVDLPSGTLAAGATFLVAIGAASAFETAFGFAPDAAAPDLSARGRWAVGTMGLANDGDELLVLDRSDTLVDVVTFEEGGYDGITDGPTAAVDEPTVRAPVDQDTDDGSMDFVIGVSCADDATCGDCGVCAAGACAQAESGSGCDDGDACTSGETCDADGLCGGGEPICMDGGVAEDAGLAEDGGVGDAGTAPDGGDRGDAGRDGGRAMDAGAGSRDEGGCSAAPGPAAPSSLLLFLVLVLRRRR